MSEDSTAKLVPCPDCKGKPKPDPNCKLCAGSGVVPESGVKKYPR